MSGTIQIQSANDKGTKFTLVFPLPFNRNEQADNNSEVVNKMMWKVVELTG